ncbi:TPA: type VI secretion system contractile sheath large subunit [Pseudomonas putida]|uniref:Type VI secretion protein, EvpB/VC_A0108 family n=1 Tax=Pseudomonas putida (strain GB-1) TaxID=76869 RepID=B0KHN5_PSEPG|nr:MULTISPECIES: type VI secretion system contractile sheath large subunit [Pseudomonas]ABY99117.1 type VI secretion protein, EvpB/VC_A0108 family [Pseudomonas putida GB-1]APE99343.1 type VI secretion protein [Pseudomonas putida]MBP0708675.1 type VI secretion system contractile sheath large subunit [Pseudomonas sp. T34]MCE1000271.1 type VI secretion system contractile sheath large subunit [Pseudomonas sp. NMI1173_11]MCK2188113.1 type VI secretion system contractile sheath large subunit [Pseudo
MPKPSNTNISEDTTTGTISNATLLDQIMAETKLIPTHEGYQVARHGVSAFIAEILKSNDPDQLINKHRVDQMIAEVDRVLGKQMDAILHHPEFQQLESSWRGLKILVDRTDFRENIKLEVLHANKEDLLDDFENAADITCSGIYKHVYTAGYGQFGGEPIAAMVGNYSFGPSSPDIKLLSYMASVGAMSHAPFLAAPSPEFFNLSSFEELPNLKEIKDLFAGPRHAKWRAFRESEDARHVALTGPRFMLRSAYHPQEKPIESFNYHENIAGQHDNYLWGNSTFLLASCINDSFARYRWCPNIIGPQSGGAVEDLPVHLYESLGQLQAKIPTEVLISDRKEFELAEEGFIALTMRKDSDNAAFFSANSVQKPKNFPKTPEGLQAQTNYKLGTQLPYLFIVNRLAHYIKVLQREQIGSWKERRDLESELNKWIKQYVADQENPSADVRSRRPLRAAKVEVSDVAGDPGWYQVSLAVRPHFKYMGANFEISLVGRLDTQ